MDPRTNGYRTYAIHIGILVARYCTVGTLPIVPTVPNALKFWSLFRRFVIKYSRAIFNQNQEKVNKHRIN